MVAGDDGADDPAVVKLQAQLDDLQQRYDELHATNRQTTGTP